MTTHNSHKKKTYIHDPGGIRTRYPKKREATDPLHRRRGHRDRPLDIGNIRTAAKHCMEDMTTGRESHEIATGSDDKCDIQNAVVDKHLFLDIQQKQPLTLEVPYCLKKAASVTVLWGIQKIAFCV
jgi:hypothetical protein